MSGKLTHLVFYNELNFIVVNFSDLNVTNVISSSWMKDHLDWVENCKQINNFLQRMASFSNKNTKANRSFNSLTCTTTPA